VSVANKNSTGEDQKVINSMKMVRGRDIKHFRDLEVYKRAYPAAKRANNFNLSNY